MINKLTVYTNVIGKDLLEFNSGDDNSLKNRSRGAPDTYELIVTLLI